MYNNGRGYVRGKLGISPGWNLYAMLTNNHYKY